MTDTPHPPTVPPPLPPAIEARLDEYANAVVEAADAHYYGPLKERASLSAEIGKEIADAERWRYFRQFLSVEDDAAEGVQFLFVNDTGASDVVYAPGFENTVESLVDVAIDAARRSTPSASPQ